MSFTSRGLEKQRITIQVLIKSISPDMPYSIVSQTTPGVPLILLVILAIPDYQMCRCRERVKLYRISSPPGQD
jgi:hypothetical protein